MSKTRYAHPEIQKSVKDLAEEGYRPAEIHKQIKGEGLFAKHEWTPSVRTIERMVRDIMPPDPSGPWSLQDAKAKPEEARIVLDVLAAMVEKSPGRLWPTRDLADWIVRIHAAAPTLDPWDIYVFANRYRTLTEQRKDTTQDDLILAFKGWESAEAMQRYRAALSAMLSLDVVDVTSIPEMLFIKE